MQWILANLSLGIINLFPILPLDGGRALLLLLEQHIGKATAKKWMNQISFLCLIPATFGMAVLFWKADGTFGMITILIFLCYTLLSGNRLIKYQKIHHTAFRMEKGDFPETLPVEHLGVRWDYPAKKLLKNFRGDKYYVVNVFREGVLVKTLTETQILNRVLTSERSITISEC